MLPVLVFAACRLTFRLAYGRPLDNVAFLDRSFVALALSVLWSHLSPPGSSARRWARFAIWVACSSIIFGIAWGSVELLAPTPEAVVWGMAALGVAGLLFQLIFY